MAGPGALAAVEEEGAEASGLGLLLEREDAGGAAALRSVQEPAESVGLQGPDGVYGAASGGPVAEVLGVEVELGMEGVEFGDRFG